MLNANGMVCTVFALSQLFATQPLIAQVSATAFERCLTYAEAFEELQNEWQLYSKSTESLLSERADALKRLSETNQAVAQLVSVQTMQRLTAFEGELLNEIQQSSLNARLSRTSALSGDIEATESNLMTAATSQLAQSVMQMELLNHQIRTTNEAGRLVLERRKSLLEELQSVVNELIALDTKSHELFHQYWELADVAGVKSNLELRSGRRMLQRASADNLGARFAQAITSMRLGDLNGAFSLLNSLVQIPAVRGVALAARAEVQVRMGKKDAAVPDIRNALAIGKNDPRVRMHRAMAFSADGNLNAAEVEWEAVLKLGTQEIAARRALALIHACSPNLTDRNKAKASECAHVATKLSGGEDWACNMAVALAAFANGRTDEALDAAQRASELAIGERRVFCNTAREHFEAGTRLFWKF